MSTFNAQAILLISGPAKQSQLNDVQALLTSTLEPFNLSVKDIQSISLGGRIIIATLIDCDSAHLPAIEHDLSSALKSHDLDVATELI